MHLISSTNNDGYFSALFKTWKKCGLQSEQTPAKSSLSEFRDKVSYKFFEEFFTNDFERLNPRRKKFNGFYIYAIDGDQYNLPASTDVIKNGYRGWPLRKRQETHYPKMYVAQAYDVVNGLVRKFSYSTAQDESHLAREIVQDFESNSVTIYDRLHSGYNTVFAHTEANNHFIVRARTSGPGVQKDIKKFCNSKKRSESILLYPVSERRLKPPLAVRLVKEKNPRSGEELVFMTSLSEAEFSDNQIAKLYQRRWEIEGSFRDQTATLKVEQWHSKKLNGILQEIFAMLWLKNAARAECLRAEKINVKNWLDHEYTKSNFKLCVVIMIENLELLLMNKLTLFRKILLHWLSRSLEKRKHLSRNYPRVIKLRGQDYGWANLVPRRC